MRIMLHCRGKHAIHVDMTDNTQLVVCQPVSCRLAATYTVAPPVGSTGIIPAHANLSLFRFLLITGIAGRKFGYGSGERRASQGGGEGGHD